MTPKEKFESIVEKFKDYTYVASNGGNDEMTNENAAKQCALICVDEILNINSVDKDYYLSDYWQQVKQEIEKL